ncbi:MAG: RluA family pseudouridine synthase [Chloroflexi bacterium]|nr:RluA family pseudouridine synthase [Chloroflexota bacterium]
MSQSHTAPGHPYSGIGELEQPWHTPEERTLSFVVDERGLGLRLDQAISFYAPEVTRSQASKLIQEGNVRSGSRMAIRSHRVYLDERVEVFLPIPPPATVQPEPMPLDIRYEDDDVLIVDKPAGLVVHPAYGHETGTLVNGLLAHAGTLPDNGLAFRPGIVHRLDKDTSGLLVVAKTPLALANIQQQFKRGTVTKAYLALVAGRPQGSEGVIDLPLARDPRDRQRMAVVPSGRPARTRWRITEELPGYTLLEARLETGRTHQIRVHLRASGHPIVGDQVYGEQRHAQGLRRQFLHAHLLELRHPTTDQALSFRSLLPTDLAAVLERMRIKAARRPSYL